ncbi:MAG: Na+/H+ antiporter subunit G [Gordonia sp.]|uniref:Monovalent cation/H(+) antiporter subunit G n=1 Tax=Gordonia rubripertincta TaxID=36822 RepID=A0ABT4N3Q0_GORRU|nr:MULTISPECIES: monovalent cation/H(+) antiporter subunit G [Mycobacteriales]MBA4023357.1 Na+/H+ antiporter subunit G [Gordonia sp. (in: high G+C Gram-positive bacteria)]MCZ4553887.1 monovalent cation/H(+) antiporter subunit G [Gordonia rubripertincta]OZG26293.1 cation:proton antiporter [Williamsia sp. 1138]
MIADIVVAVLMLTGSTMAFTASIGILRFPDTMTRMHAATKPQTLGLILVLLGAGVRLWDTIDFGMLVLSGIFALITAPVIAHRVGKLAYQEQRIRDDLIDSDDVESPRTD